MVLVSSVAQGKKTELRSSPLEADQCNCFTVRKAARQISRFYDAHLHPTGLRITQFLILTALNEIGCAGMIELAERLDVEQTAMGKMVATLQRDRLVAVRRSPADGRSRIVELTAEGSSLLNKAIPLWREAQRQFNELNGSKTVGALRSGFKFPTRVQG